MSDWIAETLSRKPLVVRDDTDVERLSVEIAERLEALLAVHNGLAPTLEGWRELALALALQYEPALQIETPVDRDSLGGRPAGWTGFAVRSAMKAEMRRGAKSERAAAKAIGRRFGIAPKTAQNLMAKPSAPDELRRLKYEITAQKAAEIAAAKLSRE